MTARTSFRLLASLALGVGGSCGGSAGGVPTEDRAYVALADLLDGVRVEAVDPYELGGAPRVAWTEGSLCGLHVRIPRDRAVRIAGAPAGRPAFRLPLPVVPTRDREGALDRLRLGSAGRTEPGRKREADGDPGGDPDLRIVGGAMEVRLRAGGELPDPVEVAYPVDLGALVPARRDGVPLAPAADRRALVRARILRGTAEHEGLVVAAGARVTVELPPLPAGEIRIPWIASPADAEGLELLARLEGPERARRVEPGRVTLALEGAPEGARLELEATGPPGTAVHLVSPAFVRAEPRDAPPNVLLVILDTLRADRLGSYGNADGLTPSLDALAERSIRFADCWSTSSWTLPAIASILTSNHGGQHGAWLGGRRLGDALDTLPEVFRRAGYRTAAFTDGGFFGRAFGLERGFHVFCDEGAGVESMVERARVFLEDAEGEPWLLVLHTYETHAPYEVSPEELREARADHPGVLGGRSPAPSEFRDELRPAGDGGSEVPDEVVALLRDLYDRGVAHADAVLGAFLDELDLAGELADAVVVVTSDHGEEFGEHGLLGHSDTLYVEQLHVPLIVHLPGGARAGEVDRRPVSLLDLAPTILDAAGLGARIPRTTFVGASLLSSDGTSPLYATRNHPEAGLLRALRADGRVLVRGSYRWERAEAGTELYLLDHDPLMLRNRAGELSEAEAALRLRLRDVSARLDAPRGEAGSAQTDRELRERLEALGYAEAAER